MQIAANAVAFHQRFVILGGFHRDKIVLRPQEDDSGRCVFADVVQRRNFLPVLLDPAVPIAIRSVIEHGIEQHQRVWTGADTELFVFFVKTPGGSRGCRHVSACRTASGSDPLGVNSQFTGMQPDPPDS